MKTRSVKFFKGQPVKHMRRGVHGIILTMVSSVKGESGTQHTVSQADWETHGSVQYLPIKTNDELRHLVRR